MNSSSPRPVSPEVGYWGQGALAVGDLDPVEAGLDAQLRVLQGVLEREGEAVAIAAVAEGDVDVDDTHGVSRSC
jgi:hypothetical protein